MEGIDDTPSRGEGVDVTPANSCGRPRSAVGVGMNRLVCLSMRAFFLTLSRLLGMNQFVEKVVKNPLAGWAAIYWGSLNFNQSRNYRWFIKFKRLFAAFLEILLTIAK